jgi:soluble lytic murein transglycosylase-like protein
MAALKYGLAFGMVLVTATAAHGEAVSRWQPYVGEASSRFGIPETWINRVMRAESGGRTATNGRPIRSRSGAMGLMQLMPGTWSEMKRIHGLGPDADDPRDNILAGTAYLRLLYDRFGYPGMFAAYNAGPARYAAYLTTGRALPAETIAYLRLVSGTKLPAKLVAKVPLQSLFAVRHDSGSDHDTSPAKATSEGRLFAVRKSDDAQ